MKQQEIAIAFADAAGAMNCTYDLLATVTTIASAAIKQGREGLDHDKPLSATAALQSVVAMCHGIALLTEDAGSYLDAEREDLEQLASAVLAMLPEGKK